MFSSLDARMRSFIRWPCSDIQKPEVLAAAGFFYLDVMDQVRCFHCNGGLRSWQQEDDAWFEHAKWFPSCEFVSLVKGKAYVSDVQRKLKPTLQQAMTSNPVKLALQMGLDEARIRMATKAHMKSTGHPFTSVEELIEVILDNQFNEEQSEEVSPSVREVSRILDNIFNGPSTRPSTSSSVNTPDETNDIVQTIEHSSHSVSDNSNNLEEIAPAPSSPTASVINEPLLDQTVATATPTQSPPISPRQIPPALSAGTSTTGANSLEEENRKLKDARLCKVCMDAEVGVVFLPCGHLGKYLEILYSNY